MRTGDTPEARILCTRFLPSDERVVFDLLFARGRWVVFVRCVIFGMKKENVVKWTLLEYLKLICKILRMLLFYNNSVESLV